MRRPCVFALFLSAVFILGGTAVYGEWFDGEVDKIDLQEKILTLSEIDPITEADEKEEIVIEDATVYSGVKSLQDLKVGDNVTVEAKYDEPTDSWKAVSVEMAEAGE